MNWPAALRGYLVRSSWDVVGQNYMLLELKAGWEDWPQTQKRNESGSEDCAHEESAEKLSERCLGGQEGAAEREEES